MQETIIEIKEKTEAPQTDFSACPDVRLAEPEDFHELMRLTKLAHSEIGVHSYSEDKVINVLMLHFKKLGGLVGLIGEKGGEIKGYIILVIDKPWYSDDFILSELNLFVAPDHRKSNYAKQLMAFSKKSSDVLDLELAIGVMSNERTAAKLRLYQRQFPQFGAVFMYKPQA